MYRQFYLLACFALAVAAGPLAAQPFGPTVTRATIESNVEYAIYTDPVVQAELKLTAEQKAKLAKIPDDVLAKHKEAIEKQQAASKEAADKQAAAQAELQKKIDGLLAKHLSAAQQKRFGQLVTQARINSNSGFVFRGAEMVKALSLTEEQQTKLAELQRAASQKLQKEFGDAFPPAMDLETRRKYTAAQRKMIPDVITQFVETLKDEQKKTWKEMTGEPSDAVKVEDVVIQSRPGLGFRVSPISPLYWQASLLTNEKALAELKLEKPASEALATGWTAIRKEAAPGGGPGDFDFPGLFGIQTTITREAATLAAAVLTEPQTKRLGQIQFQLRGTTAFSTTPFTMGTLRADTTERNILAKLTLTPAQATKIDAILAQAAKKQQTLGFGPGFFPPLFRTKETEEQKKARLEYLEKSNAIEQKALADLLATFDVGQKAVWQEMTGEVIDTTKITAAVSPRRGPGFGGGKGGAANTSIVTNWSREATRRQARGEYAAALSAIDEAIRLAPTVTSYQLQKATMLATCPADLVRDGKQAVEIVRKVMDQTKEPTYGQYHILAAAYAEAGQFDEAVKTQQKALDALPPPPKEKSDTPGSGFPDLATRLKPDYEARLALYKEKKPFRASLPKQRQRQDR